MGARAEMIDAAERLVAERGMGAMSLREVQAAAGQRNKSAAQYHFGSREGLIEAIVTSRMARINQQRLDRLAALPPGGQAPDIRALVEVLIEPLAEATLRRGSCWARFLVQGWSDPALSEVVRRSTEGEGYRATIERLAAVLEPLPAPLRARRIERVLGLAFTSLAAAELRCQAPSTSPGAELTAAAEIADLVDVCTAVLEAPASPTTRSELRAGHRSA